MKVEVIKPKEDKPYWDYPCKGIRKKDGVVVGFEKFGSGCVLESGQSKMKLYTSYVFLDMADFSPIKEKGNNYDWNNPTFPILVKGSGEDVFTINGFDEVDNSVSITTFSFNKRVHHWCEEIARFSSEEDRNKWLRSLEMLPKGTEIKITF